MRHSIDRNRPLSVTRPPASFAETYADAEFTVANTDTYLPVVSSGHLTPHVLQFRESGTATLLPIGGLAPSSMVLLNSGMLLHMVQEGLVHKRLSTTTRYARSYGGTVAADHSRAIMTVEHWLAPENPAVFAISEWGNRTRPE